MKEHSPALPKLLACLLVGTVFCAVWLAARAGAVGGQVPANRQPPANKQTAPQIAAPEQTRSEPPPVVQEHQPPTLPPELAQKVAELRQRIAGQENKPAEEVFKNIQILKGIPAGRVLRIMEMGYSRSLGVNCTHCHVVGEWEKDDKPTKNIARDMARMVGTINNDLLKNIKNLQSQNPVVNCTTCHRGQTRPVPNAPPAGAPAQTPRP